MRFFLIILLYYIRIPFCYFFTKSRRMPRPVDGDECLILEFYEFFFIQASEPFSAEDWLIPTKFSIIHRDDFGMFGSSAFFLATVSAIDFEFHRSFR